MKEKFESPEDVVIKLKKLIKKIEHQSSQFEKSGITHSQARIIWPIIKNGCGYSVVELSNLAGVDKALVSRTVADLESKGFLKREALENSVKNVKIVLSKQGSEFYLKQHKKAKEESAKWLNGATKEELINFKKVLDKLTEKS